MQKTFLIVVFISFFSFSLSAQKNVLSNGYSAEKMKELLIPASGFKPYPGINDRLEWDKVPAAVKNRLISKAEKNLGYKWPPLSATLTLEFVRTGNRTNYEDVSFEKRKVLINLLLAELLENKGRFIDDIINGVWSICEESYWGLPAHLKHSEAGEGLVDVKAPFVDLFSAETARILSLTNYFLKDRFDKVSPQIAQRISAEIQQRVLIPVMTKPHMWMTFANNWNTWISASWMTTVLLEEKNDSIRAAAVAKILSGLDNFLNAYPEDGGCDEGPAYWTAAGASLYENLYLLSKATSGKYNQWNNSKIRKIGEYITKVRLTDEYILNFADAPAKSKYAPSWVYFCGEMIGNKEMMAYGAEGVDNDLENISTYHFNRLIELLLNYDKIKSYPGQKPYPPDIWMDRIQVMVARDYEGSDKGFVLSAKGGSNSESHNHNDVGSFMIYYNGKPALIDVGKGTYTARTFSDQRYSIWFNASDFHNVPAINDTPQFSATGTNAKNVLYTKSDKSATLSADLSPAYPKEVGVILLNRTLSLNRKKDITLNDRIELRAPGTLIENFMLCTKPDVSQAGKVIFVVDGTPLSLTYDAGVFTAAYEKMKLDLPEDTGFKDAWGEVFRLSLTAKEKFRKANVKFYISKL